LLGLKLFLLLVFGSLVFSWQTELEVQIHNSFNKQGRIVTFSIQEDEPLSINNELIEKVIYPSDFNYGYNKVIFILKTHKEIKHEVKLDIRERIPVTKINLDSGQSIEESCLSDKWIKISSLTNFVIRDEKELIGKVSKYYKSDGNYFYNNDIRSKEVIHSGDRCSIHLIYNSIQITMPGISLKNGAIGSKIKVINETTNKALDVYVIDSRNVEVKM